LTGNEDRRILATRLLRVDAPVASRELYGLTATAREIKIVEGAA
jgi:hypothetical protein